MKTKLKLLCVLLTVTAMLGVMTAIVSASSTPLDLVMVLDNSSAMNVETTVYIPLDNDSYTYDNFTENKYYYLYNDVYYLVTKYKFSSNYYLKCSIDSSNSLYLNGNSVVTKRKEVEYTSTDSGAEIYSGTLYVKDTLLALKRAANAAVGQIVTDANNNSLDHRIGIYTYDSKLSTKNADMTTVRNASKPKSLYDTIEELTISESTASEAANLDKVRNLLVSGTSVLATDRKAVLIFNSGTTSYTDAIATMIEAGIKVYLVTTNWTDSITYGECGADGTCANPVSVDSLTDAFTGAVTLALSAEETEVTFNVSYQNGSTIECTCAFGETYDLTEGVTAGYLYGGTYTSDTYDTAYSFSSGENGKSFTPADGETYYVRDVKQEYLWPMSLLIYSTAEETQGQLIDMILYSAIDSIENYQKVGFAVKTSVTGSEYRRNEMTNVYGKLRINFTDTETTYDYSSDDVHSSLEDNKPIFVYRMPKASDKLNSAEYSFFPYYVTLDGVMVKGNVYRKVSYDNSASPKLQKNQLYYTTNIVDSSWSNTVGDLNLFAASYAAINAEKRIGLTLLDTLSLSIDRAGENTAEYTITKIYGNVTETQTVSEGDARGEITYAEKDGYIFAGWYSDRGLRKAADFSSVSSDMTVYAKYITDDVEVTFEDDYYTVKTGADLGSLIARCGRLEAEIEPEVETEDVKKEAYWEICRSILARVRKTKVTYTYYIPANVEIEIYYTTADGTEVKLY